MGRTIAGNARRVVTIWFDADRQSRSIAGSMAVATNTFSPMAAGVHGPSTQVRGYSGIPGYGVNRFGTDVGVMQGFVGAIQPIHTPANYRLGIGLGVSGQPGMPQSGQDAGGLAGLGLGQMTSLGMGA